MRKAAKRKTCWLLLAASALALIGSWPAPLRASITPASTSSHAVLPLETRAELPAENRQNGVELSLLTPETASSYYDPFGEVAPDSPVAPRVTADVSTLRGRQLASEFTGNKIKRFRRQMQAQGGYGDFPPIKIAEINGKKIIIDGHHRARAAGAAGIREVPVEIIDLPPDVARKYFEQAAEAAERLGLPF